MPAARASRGMRAAGTLNSMRKYVLMNLGLAALTGIFNGPVLTVFETLARARRWWKG